MNFKIYIDGASRGNPGNSGIGILILKDGVTFKEISEYIGITTNNQAEYLALIKALRELEKSSSNSALIFSDSELLVKQWNGKYQVKDEKLKSLYHQAKTISTDKRINLSFIPREKNKQADFLANQGIDEFLKKKKTNRLLNNNHEEIQISAGGVIYKKERHQIKVCLIAKKNKQIWALPKGRVDKGETPEETAVREVREETGCEVELKERIDEINYYFHLRENDVVYHKYVYFYLMPLIKENAYQRDQEADEVSWFTLGEAQKKLSFLNEKNVIRKARHLFEF
ncbi:MAG: NUDIX domain-containing protein [Armatimonadetes bacterium]|nr:NUDIX domain-containing protein [Armatimonadota bacterium]